MLINNPVITGSFLVNGVNVAGITGSSELSSSYVITSASYAAASASLSTRVTNVETTASVLTTASSSFAVVSSSYASASGSLSTRVTNLESTSSTVSSSFAATSGSISSRVNIIETSYATTGSNNFTAPQQVSNTSNAISFTSTASLYTAGGLRVSKDSFVSGTAYFNNVVVYGTSSIQYITSSQVNIGTNIITVNTDTPAVRFGGLAVFDSGSTALTGSLLWDSQNNRWIYSNPSGSTYDGGMLISGPRNSTGLGNEVGTTACAVMIGQGGDHITSSGIFSYGNATCFYGNSFISSSGAMCIGGSFTGTSAVFTGSLNVTGSFCVVTTAAELQVGATGVTLGNALTDVHQVTGSLRVTGSGNHFILGCNLLIGTTTSTLGKLEVIGSGGVRVNEDGAGTKVIQIRSDFAGVDPAINVSTNNALLLQTNNTERMRFTNAGIACFACQTCAPGMDIMPSGIGVSTLGGIMRVVTTGTSAGIAVGQSNANRYTHFAANDIQVFNDDYFIATRCAFPLSIGTCYTARLTFAATGVACFSCQVCAPQIIGTQGVNIGANALTADRMFQISGTAFTSGATQFAAVINPSFSGTITNVYGIYGGNNFNTGTITNSYNLYIEGTSLGSATVTNRFGLYQAGGSDKNYFAGNVGIGTTTINTRFHIYQTGQPDISCALYATQILQTDSQANYQRIRFDRDSCPFWGIGVEGASSTNDLIISGLIGGKTSGTWSDNVFRIKNSNGNVGIGQPSPTYRLEVCNSNSCLLGLMSANDGVKVDMVGYGTSLTYPQARIELTDAGFYGGILNFYTKANGAQSNGLVVRMKIFESGITCFGYTVCAPCFATISDYRMKSNLRPIDGLSIIMNTKPYKFEYNYDCSTSFGMIAHELQEVVPEAVFGVKDGETMQGVDYMKLLPIAIKAIQEQQCEIKQLKTCLGIN